MEAITGMVLYVMGVSGSGKSTIGKRLAKRLGFTFADGDDYHSAQNKEKMSHGIPLTDEDREPWLRSLNAVARQDQAAGTSVVIACSALRAVYREWLTEGLDRSRVRFILLDGSREVIAERMRKRTGHFMNPSLLQSQFDTLEPPADAVRVPIDDDTAAVVEKIVLQLGPMAVQDGI